jgi:hypothetical protein
VKTRDVIVLAVTALVLAAGCTRKRQPEPEGYRIVSYDSTGKWVIIRTGTFDGKFLKKRLTVQCDFYKWGDHEMVKGPQACNLEVGRLMVSKHPQQDSQGRFPGSLDIWEMSSDRLAITEGDGPDRVSQQFVILKNEVMPD